jgi:hypothetical protein
MESVHAFTSRFDLTSLNWSFSIFWAPFFACILNVRSPPSSAEVKNAWRYTSPPLIRLHGMVLS